MKEGFVTLDLALPDGMDDKTFRKDLEELLEKEEIYFYSLMGMAEFECTNEEEPIAARRAYAELMQKLPENWRTKRAFLTVHTRGQGKWLLTCKLLEKGEYAN